MLLSGQASVKIVCDFWLRAKSQGGEGENAVTENSDEGRSSFD
jgi:hypothetical protein